MSQAFSSEPGWEGELGWSEGGRRLNVEKATSKEDCHDQGRRENLGQHKNKEKKDKWPKQGWSSSKKTKTKKTRTIKRGRCDKCGSWWRAGVMKSRASYVGTTVPAQLCSTYQLSLPPCPPTPTHFSPRCPDFALSQQLCPTLLAPHELERLC